MPNDVPEPRIQLLREIATGPMSAMFVARRVANGQVDLVAIKVLTHRMPGDVERALKVRDGGRAVARIGHRHLVCVEEVLQVGPFVGLLSPFVDGIDLLDWQQMLSETAVDTPGRVICDIVRGTATALDTALNRIPLGDGEPLHKEHRDVRPSNIMISRDCELKLIDFGSGFSALSGRSARAGALQKGLIKYMAPERREGLRGGPGSDVYSLGILAVELFRGRWMRRLRSHNPAHDRHLAEVVARLGDLGMRTNADELGLRNILLRMVAYDPEARPVASEVAQTFRVLSDRAHGPSLESFAMAHAVPWMEHLWSHPDHELLGTPIHILDTGATTRSIPIEDDLTETPLLREVRGDDWEETSSGWREATGDIAMPEELIDPFFDDDDDETLDEFFPSMKLQDLALLSEEVAGVVPPPPPQQDESQTTHWEITPPELLRQQPDDEDVDDDPTQWEPAIPDLDLPASPQPRRRRRRHRRTRSRTPVAAEEAPTVNDEATARVADAEAPTASDELEQQWADATPATDPRIEAPPTTASSPPTTTSLPPAEKREEVHRLHSVVPVGGRIKAKPPPRREDETSPAPSRSGMPVAVNLLLVGAVAAGALALGVVLTLLVVLVLL